MAVYNYLGDRFVCDFETDTKPTNTMDGAYLSVLSSRLNYIKRSGVWNVCESSGIFPLFSGMLSGQTPVVIDNKWSGTYNLYNNNDVIGFGFTPNTPLPLNKGHFYTNSGNVGWATGIILECQSNSGLDSYTDWGDLTTMLDSGDWGNLTTMTASGDWGDLSAISGTTPGISIDVKLSQDRRTVSAIRFKRLVSGTNNYDSTVEFWVMDSGTLVQKFWIQSGQFLPGTSGTNFLGSSNLSFSGIYTNNAIVNGILGIGTQSPLYNTHIKASNVTLGIESTNSSAEIDFVNSISNKCSILYTGSKLGFCAGTINVPTITIMTGTPGPGQVGIRTPEPRSDLELLRNDVGPSQNNNFGLFIRNDSPATVITGDQYSPPLNFRGSFWNPTGLNTVTSDFRIYNSTSSGFNPLGSGSGALVFEGQTGDAGYKELMRLDYDAGLKLASGRTFNSGVVFADHRGGLMEASGMCFDTGNNVLKIKTLGGNQARYHVGGMLYTSLDAAQVYTNVPATLFQYNMPASTITLAKGDRVKIDAAGLFGVQTVNPYTGTKQLRFGLQGTTLFNIAVPSGDFGNWTFNGTIVNGTASDCIVNYTLYTGLNGFPSLIANMGVGVWFGYSTSDTLIAFTGIGSGVYQNTLEVSFHPGNLG